MGDKERTFNPEVDPPWLLFDTLDKIKSPKLNAAGFGLCPDVLIDLELLENKTCEKPQPYKLKNPTAVAEQLNLPVNLLTGYSQMSPSSPVTVAWGLRGTVHIPLNATSFTWANPLLPKTDNWISAENNTFCFLAFGGFVYYNSEFEVVAINAIKVGDDLAFEGPCRLAGDPIRKKVFEEMQATKRINDITLGPLREFPKKFAWVRPQEFPDAPLGAFVYEYDKPEHNRYIRMQPPQPTVDLLKDLAEDLGLQVEIIYQRMMVVSISDNSVVKPLQVRRGDILLKWNTQMVTKEQEFLRFYNYTRPEQAIALTIISEGQDQNNCRTGYFRMPYKRGCEQNNLIVAEKQHYIEFPSHVKENLEFEQIRDDVHFNFLDVDIRKLQLEPPYYYVTVGSRKIKGRISPWSYVNLGLKSQQWIPVEADCFAFCYSPPEHEIGDLSAADDATRGFILNGGYIYFHYIIQEERKDLIKAVAIVTERGPTENRVTLTFTLKKEQPKLANIQQVIEQKEMAPVLRNSIWNHEDLYCIAWVPPFCFGESSQYLYGGFACISNDHKKIRYYNFSGSWDDFWAKKDKVKVDLQQVRDEKQQLLKNLMTFDPHFSVITAEDSDPRQEKWSLMDEVPSMMRVAAALLSALGRDGDAKSTREVVTGIGHYEFCSSEKLVVGIPNFKLKPNFLIPERIDLDSHSIARFIADHNGEEAFNIALKTIGWMFQPGLPAGMDSYNEQPHVNLRGWYGSIYTGAQGQNEDTNLNNLIRNISFKGFRILRQWIFDAGLTVDEAAKPLLLLDNQVIKHIEIFPECDISIVKEIMNYSVAQIVRAPRILELKEIYGNLRWTLSRKDYEYILQSTRIYTSDILPPKFFKELSAILSNDDHAQFWKDKAPLSLYDIKSIETKTISQEHVDAVIDMKNFLDRVESNMDLYGFSKDTFGTATNSPLCSLSTSVCVAQQGYFILGDTNRIQERADATILFVSACAPDFYAPTKRMQARQELQKYFIPPNQKGRWRTHGMYHGRQALLERIMEIWHRVFMACRDGEVKHPSLIPIGLGIFRPRVQEESDAMAVYFEAQFKLLETNDYGFDTVYISPGPPANHTAMMHVLAKRCWYFKCNIQLHRKDAKSVANAHAKKGNRSCCIIPADFLAVLQGLIGSWWETGYHERYTGESHIVSTSTAILARKNICDVWGDEKRIKLQKLNDSKTTVPCATYDFSVKSGTPTQMSLSQVVFLDFPMWWVGASAKKEERPPLGVTKVIEMLRRSQWGAIDVKEVVYNDAKRIRELLEKDEAQRKEEKHSKDKHKPPAYTQIDFREAIYNTLLETIKTKEVRASSLEELNAVIVRFDYCKLRTLPVSEMLCKILAALVDIRCKGLFPGVIVAATTNGLSAQQANFVQNLGAEAVFCFPGSDSGIDYPVKQTFDSLMRVICQHQRFTISLTQAVYDKRMRTIQKLLANGADPDYINSANGPWAPLHWAVSSQCKTIRDPLISELQYRDADVNIRSRYPRRGKPLGWKPEIPDHLKTGKKDDKKDKDEAQPKCRLWGLWLTLRMNGMQTPEQSAVPRLRWAMANHKSLALWQVYLDNPDVEITEEQWEDWLPTNTNNNTERNQIGYLRYVVVELIGDNSEGSVRWLDNVVGSIVSRLFIRKHPCNPTEKKWAWTNWIRESVLVFIHGGNVLYEDPNPKRKSKAAAQTFFKGADQKVWYNKKFPLTYQHHEVKDYVPFVEVCVESRELAQKLEIASVHWLVLTGKGEPPFKHYNMPFCMELENNYRAGLHVVQKPVSAHKRSTEHKKKWEVNLNLMIEVKYEEDERGHFVFYDGIPEGTKYNIKGVRKVVRMPDHLSIVDELASAPHIIQEIRTGNCLLFLGAGFSFPAKLPSWTDLLLKTAKMAHDAISKEGVVVTIGKEEKIISIFKKNENASEGEDYKVEIQVLKGEAKQAEIVVSAEKIRMMSDQVNELVANPNHENLEMSAQLLEDALQFMMKWFLKGMLEFKGDNLLNGHFILQNSSQSDYQIMAARLLMVKHLPVSGILTTNYDQLLCYCDEQKRKKNPCCVAVGVTPMAKQEKPKYMRMIRNRQKGEVIAVPIKQEPENATRSVEDDDSIIKVDDDRLVIQIHGSTSDPQSIVLTREGYRGLLHLNAAYSNFLKTVMAGNTLLYMGFSFTDGYFNEIRSELMTLQEEKQIKENPFSYAVIDSKPDAVRDFFTHHEGVHLFSWEPSRHGFGVMDRYLEGFLRSTHLAAALSQCKVLLFNPQTSPLFIVHDQKVEIVSHKDLLDTYLPYEWNSRDKYDGVVCRKGVYRQVDNWVLVKLKSNFSIDGESENVQTQFRKKLTTACSRPFFIPKQYLSGDLREGAEMTINAEMVAAELSGHNVIDDIQKRITDPKSIDIRNTLRIVVNQQLKEQMGMDPRFYQHLIPFGLKVMDTRCYAVKISGAERVLVLPNTLLRLKTSKETSTNESTTQQPFTMDVTRIVREVSERLKSSEDTTDREGKKELVLYDALTKIQDKFESSLARTTTTMDHTMETIAEQLNQAREHPLFADAAKCAPLQGHFQPFILHSNITSLPALKADIGKETTQAEAVKTFIILNAANVTAVPLPHHQLFVELYSSNAPYLQWAYPPRTIIHTGGDQSIVGKYKDIFSHNALSSLWTSYVSNVAGVMEEIMRPLPPISEHLPILFQGKGKFEQANYILFNDTVSKSEDDKSSWPEIPFHALGYAHVSGRQDKE